MYISSINIKDTASTVLMNAVLYQLSRQSETVAAPGLEEVPPGQGMGPVLLVGQ